MINKSYDQRNLNIIENSNSNQITPIQIGFIFSKEKPFKITLKTTYMN